MGVYATFGQELYLRESARAAKQSAARPGEDGLAARVAEGLPHPSPATRARVASKIVQRLAAGSADAAHRAAFARLVAGLGDSEARRALIYYGAARADSLIGAIAREVLHPYFVDGRLPRGVTEAEFTVQNTGLLLTVEPMLTQVFAAWYAEKRWSFGSARTVALALRILRQAGILLPVSLCREGRRALAYTLAPHGLPLPAFVWCLYDEFVDAPHSPTVDRIECAAFARTLVVPPAVIAACLREAEREGFVRYMEAGTRRVLLPLSREAVVERLMVWT